MTFRRFLLRFLTWMGIIALGAFVYFEITTSHSYSHITSDESASFPSIPTLSNSPPTTPTIVVKKNPTSLVTLNTSSVFIYDFNSPGKLEEASSPSKSSSPYWWLDSGAYFIIQNGYGETVQGNLSTSDRWQKIYEQNNPVDTDGGFHPQNIFRLVSKESWQNQIDQMYFKVTANNPSESSNRNESNGLLLFSRYEDSQNLYYAGIRVDGTAVIKKKLNGVYYTLAQTQIIPGIYNRIAATNLIPNNRWIGLRLKVVNDKSGSVHFTLYDDFDASGAWGEILSAIDDGTSYGGPGITASFPSGIRTDFMDVQFSKYEIQPLP